MTCEARQWKAEWRFDHYDCYRMYETMDSTWSEASEGRMFWPLKLLQDVWPHTRHVQQGSRRLDDVLTVMTWPAVAVCLALWNVGRSNEKHDGALTIMAWLLFQDVWPHRRHVERGNGRHDGALTIMAWLLFQDVWPHRRHVERGNEKHDGALTIMAWLLFQDVWPHRRHVERGNGRHDDAAWERKTQHDRRRHLQNIRCGW